MGGSSNENFMAPTRPPHTRGETNRKPLGAINGNIIRGEKGQRRASKEPNVEACHNKIPGVLHRPITRKFAEQLARKQQQPSSSSHEAEQQNHHQPPILITHRFEEDCVITEATDDDAVPFFVRNTEALMEEIDQMDSEIEMVDIEKEDINLVLIDIDGPDKNDPLAATEYVEHLYEFYKKIESVGCVPHSYMEETQGDINERMRGILVDWLVEVHYKFELVEETLYLTVQLIDRFLAVRSVPRKKLQLVGVTALLLACKYEEVSVPVVEDLVLITDRAYSRREVLGMEKEMANALGFNVSLPTPYVFLRRCLKAVFSLWGGIGRRITLVGAGGVLHGGALPGGVRDGEVPAVPAGGGGCFHGAVRAERPQRVERGE